MMSAQAKGKAMTRPEFVVFIAGSPDGECETASE